MAHSFLNLSYVVELLILPQLYSVLTLSKHLDSPHPPVRVSWYSIIISNLPPEALSESSRINFQLSPHCAGAPAARAACRPNLQGTRPCGIVSTR